LFADLLWKAPELLREPNISPYGSQKADVYAFAIILYEIIGRKGPFGATKHEPKGMLLWHCKWQFFGRCPNQVVD
jgi:serine/threonine protein kinase